MPFAARPIRRLMLAGILIFGILSVRFRAIEQLPQDIGAAGVLQKIRKLQTTASLLHTTAHPDDEHGGMLALASRGQGVRTILLSLTRGEAGDNAIGPELFDTLGLIRTEELLISSRYYGLDELYFTTFADFGFSKRLDEALDKWGREAVLADVVRIIRIERPLVIVSRFQGNARDGHGQHQAAGELTREAFRAAADPKRFPDQIAEGLRPWQALKLYTGGVRGDQEWTIEVDPGAYDPLLGESYQTFARRGLSFQRSQNSGRFVPQPGSVPVYYVRAGIAGDRADGPTTNGNAGKEKSFFDGIDTTLAGVYRTLQRREPPDANVLLVAIDREVQQAASAFHVSNPAAAAPALSRGLAGTRNALEKLGKDPDIAHVLRIKERQFVDALTAALGISVSGVAVPQNTVEPPGGISSPFGSVPTLAPVVPGQTIGVRASFIVRSATPVLLRALDLVAPARWTVKGGNPGLISRPLENRSVAQRFDLTVGAEAAVTRSHLHRDSLEMHHYNVVGPDRHRPTPPPPVTVRAEYEIQGTIVQVMEPVLRREGRLPYGYEMRELTVVPPIVVSVTPTLAVVPASGPRKPVELTAEIINHQPREASGMVALTMPSDWRAQPASHTFHLGANERVRVSFSVSVPTVKPGAYPVQVTVTSDDRTYTEGHQIVEHRDLETRYHYTPAVTTVRVFSVGIFPNLRVGYVMGVGDTLPEAIARLGASVTMLDAQALATGALEGFDAIVLGTRAYGVRPELRASNARLLEYARNGGNLIVLYNTPEFDPATQAPLPGKLPADADEVSEEDAAVTILEPQHPVFTRPNRITAADFNGWIEQRGTKFWREWDPGYTALLECHDQDQAPQRGGWLYTRYGKGHYSYVGYAFHRQLPYGVPGAYRLLANLLSLGESS
jgi:LmbE family N-acetylglucosaminyl deacetylase